MAENQSFRTAFRGFNREDVVNYIEYINNRYQAELSRLRTENQTLRESPRQSPPDADRIQALEEELSQTKQELEQAKQELAKAKQADTASTEAELAIYRRAERTERLARERAVQLCGQAGNALAAARESLTQAEEQLAAVTMQTQAQVDRLREAVTASRQTLARTQEALSDIAQSAVK